MSSESLQLPIYVSTNNKHLNCLRAFVEIFYHFLPNQELRILGYEPPPYKLPDTCTFISLGKQGGLSEWSTDLRRYFKQNGEQYFIYGTEDAFFCKNPQINFINYLSNLMIRSDRIGRINLVDATEGDNCSLEKSPHYSVSLIKKYENSEWGPWSLYVQDKFSDYSLTTQFSIWNKDFLMKYLIDGLSPWDFERQSYRTREDKEYSVLMVEGGFPIHKKEGYSQGVWTNEGHWYKFLPKEAKDDLQILEKKLMKPPPLTRRVD